LMKNYGVGNMLITLFVTYLEYLLTTIYFLSTGNKLYGLQIVRAMIWPFKNLRKIMGKRAQVQKLRKRSDREIKRYMVPYSGDLLRILKL